MGLAIQHARGKRVCVIGAGLSGLACTYELRAAGYDVQVVEARSRLGGRVYSLPNFVKGHTVEAGGEFIGRNHPCWLAYAARFGLQLREVSRHEGRTEPILLGGKHLTDEEAKQLYAEMEIIQKQMTAEAKGVNADEPWNTPQAGALGRLSPAQWLAGLQAPTSVSAALPP